MWSVSLFIEPSPEVLKTVDEQMIDQYMALRTMPPIECKSSVDVIEAIVELQARTVVTEAEQTAISAILDEVREYARLLDAPAPTDDTLEFSRGDCVVTLVSTRFGQPARADLNE